MMYLYIIFFCDRDRIQTCNRLIRSQLLYSVELRGQTFYLFVKEVRESDRDRIQTCNRLIRSQLLYSVELRGHVSFFLTGAKIWIFFILCKCFYDFFLLLCGKKCYCMNLSPKICHPNDIPAFQFLFGEL